MDKGAKEDDSVYSHGSRTFYRVNHSRYLRKLGFGQVVWSYENGGLDRACGVLVDA